MSDVDVAARKLVAGWAAAKRAGRSQRSRARDPATALDDALELWDLNPALFDAPPDSVRVREVERVRAVWRRLRVACLGHR